MVPRNNISKLILLASEINLSFLFQNILSEPYITILVKFFDELYFANLLNKQSINIAYTPYSISFSSKEIIKIIGMKNAFLECNIAMVV